MAQWPGLQRTEGSDEIIAHSIQRRLALRNLIDESMFLERYGDLFQIRQLVFVVNKPSIFTDKRDLR